MRGMRQALRGMSIIELMLVLGIAMGFMVLDLRQSVIERDDLMARTAADIIGQLKDGAAKYAQKHQVQLVAMSDPNCAIVNFDMCVIGADKLYADGDISMSALRPNPWGASHTISIKRETDAAGRKNLTVYVATTTSWEDAPGEPKLGLLGAAAFKLGADGGYSTKTGTQAVATGYRATWTATAAENPAISAGGRLVARGGYGSARDSMFIRRDGTLNFTGDQSMGQYNLTDMGLAGLIPGGAVDTPCDPSLLKAVGADPTGRVITCRQEGLSTPYWRLVSAAQWREPATSYAGLPSAGNVVGDVRLTLDKSRAFTWTGGLWKALAVDQNGNLDVPKLASAETLVPTKVFTMGSSCAGYQQGAIAKTADGTTISCQNGFWKSALGQNWKQIVTAGANPASGTFQNSGLFMATVDTGYSGAGSIQVYINGALRVNQGWNPPGYPPMVESFVVPVSKGDSFVVYAPGGGRASHMFLLED